MSSAAPDTGPAVTPELLSERWWHYGRPGEWWKALNVRLRPDGSLGAFWKEEEVGWRLEEGRLILLDPADLRSVVFDRVAPDPEGRLVFMGRKLGGGEGTERHLCEQPPPASVEAAPELRTVTRPHAGRRANLVVLRAGDASLHARWLRNIEDDERNWDLCLSWYGSSEGFGQDTWAEWQVLGPQGRKFGALCGLFDEASPFWRYERIFFPDDDLMTSWRDLNAFFAICRRFGLELAQPAVSGFWNQPFTRPETDYLLRYVSWVETMMPCFSREALRICLPSWVGSFTGYGLDHVWPKLLGEPRDRIAIVDAVVVEHTRLGNSGDAYDLEAAYREGAEAMGRYGAPWRTLQFGGILRRPVELPPAV